MILNVILNVAVSVLLVLTISYCWVLNRRIRILQDSRSELAELLEHFDVSTKRASDSVLSLQQSSRKMQEALQPKIEHAQQMIEDIAFMIARAETSANQLEHAIRQGRTPIATRPTPAPITEPMPAPAEFKPAPKPVAEEAPPSTPAPAPKRVMPSLEQVLERIAGRSTPTHPRVKPQPVIEPTTRQRIEQELLEVLKAGV